MLMERLRLGTDAELREQLAAVARVLGGDYVCLRQQAYRPWRDILEITDRRGHDIERTGV
jgi:hypothetical protein